MPCAFARFLPFRSCAFFLSFPVLPNTSDPARAASRMPCAFARFSPFRSRAFFLSFSGLASTSDPARLSDSLLGGSARYRAFPNPFLHRRRCAAALSPLRIALRIPPRFPASNGHSCARTGARSASPAVRASPSRRAPVPARFCAAAQASSPNSPQSGERRFPFPGAAHRVPLFSCHTHVQFLRAFAAAPRSHRSENPLRPAGFSDSTAPPSRCAPHSPLPRSSARPRAFLHQKPPLCAALPALPLRALRARQSRMSSTRAACRPSAAILPVRGTRRAVQGGAPLPACRRARQCGRAGSARSDPHRWD